MAPVYPRTLDEAVERVLADLSEADRDRVRNTPRGELIRFHHGWGTGIRNAFGLWGKNRELLESLGAGGWGADAVSMQIIETVWERLQRS